MPPFYQPGITCLAGSGGLMLPQPGCAVGVTSLLMGKRQRSHAATYAPIVHITVTEPHSPLYCGTGGGWEVGARASCHQ